MMFAVHTMNHGKLVVLGDTPIEAVSAVRADHPDAIITKVKRIREQRK